MTNIIVFLLTITTHFIIGSVLFFRVIMSLMHSYWIDFIVFGLVAFIYLLVLTKVICYVFNRINIVIEN